jgi:hypothetical protein
LYDTPHLTPTIFSVGLHISDKFIDPILQLENDPFSGLFPNAPSALKRRHILRAD